MFLGQDVHVLDRLPGNVGEYLHLFARGEDLWSEDVAVADVAVLGKGERGDAGDIVGIDARYAARAGGVDDPALGADRGDPPPRVAT